MAEKYFQQWAEQHITKPINISLTMRALSGMVLGLILEYIMGDKTLEAQWDELPDFLTDMILDRLLPYPTMDRRNEENLASPPTFPDGGDPFQQSDT